MDKAVKMATKMSIGKLLKKKGVEKITAITAYDALFASIFDPLVDVMLVGDSLNMTFNGHPDTLSLSMDHMLYHARAVSGAISHPYLIIDMPYGSYTDEKMAIKNAIKVYKQTNADAIKLEGGVQKASVIKALIDEGIAVVGHIGLMPQSVRAIGGYKVRGKDVEDEARLLEDAHTLDKLGVSLLVLECVRVEVANKITKAIKAPTIGIGCGNVTDGQIIVFSDMLGLGSSEFKPKFVRRYIDLRTIVSEAVVRYTEDIQTMSFPSDEESFL